MQKIKYIKFSFLASLVLFVGAKFNGAYGQDQTKKKGVPTVRFAEDEITVDGKMNDWPSLISFYNKSAQLGYSIANDSTHFYFCFILSDQMMQMKLLRTGLFIGIDTTGKKRLDVSVHYPLPGNYSGVKKEGERPDFETIKNSFKKSPQYMSLSGFSVGNGKSPLQALNGVRAKLDWDEKGNLIYELAMPFKSFKSSGLTTHLYALNVYFPAMSRPQVDGNTGATSTGGGRPGGGGPPPGVSGGAGGNAAMLFEEQKFGQRFYLNLNK